MPIWLKTLHWRMWAQCAREEGQGLTEYALILAVVGVVAVGALSLLGGKVTSAFSTVARSI